jgi:hypothetical protein
MTALETPNRLGLAVAWWKLFKIRAVPLVAYMWEAVLWAGGRRGNGVESRMCAGADAERRPVSHPRSSNRTCRSPASGFPTDFTRKHTQTGA